MLTLAAPPPTFQPSAFPAIMESVADVQGTWWAAYVRSRQEKAFAEDLSEAGIPNYLPITQRRGLLNGKRQIICEPTFRGYTFFALRGKPGEDVYAQDFEEVTQNSRIVQRIEIRDQRLFVKQLARIQRSIEIDPMLPTCAYLVPGRRVKIAKGDFIGFEGVLEKNTKGTFHIVFEFMQSSRELEIPDETYLEPIE